MVFWCGSELVQGSSQAAQRGTWHCSYRFWHSPDMMTQSKCSWNTSKTYSPCFWRCSCSWSESCVSSREVQDCRGTTKAAFPLLTALYRQCHHGNLWIASESARSCSILMWSLGRSQNWSTLVWGTPLYLGVETAKVIDFKGDLES